jgi:hypothetical protein
MQCLCQKESINSTGKKEQLQMKEQRIEIDEIEARRRLSSQLTKYLGSVDKVKVFARECKAVGVNLTDPNVIRNIASEPEWFAVMLSYSELGLLPKIGQAVTNLIKTKE